MDEIENLFLTIDFYENILFKPNIDRIARVSVLQSLGRYYKRLNMLCAESKDTINFAVIPSKINVMLEIDNQIPWEK